MHVIQLSERQEAEGGGCWGEEREEGDPNVTTWKEERGKTSLRGIFFWGVLDRLERMMK